MLKEDCSTPSNNEKIEEKVVGFHQSYHRPRSSSRWSMDDFDEKTLRGHPGR